MLVHLDKIFTYINELSIKADSIWKSKNAVFTLICELAKFEKLPPKELVKKALEEIENKAKDTKNPEEEHYLFYMALYQGTASKKARMIRGDLLEKYLSKLKNCNDVK